MNFDRVCDVKAIWDISVFRKFWIYSINHIGRVGTSSIIWSSPFLVFFPSTYTSETSCMPNLSLWSGLQMFVISFIFLKRAYSGLINIFWCSTQLKKPKLFDFHTFADTGCPIQDPRIFRYQRLQCWRHSASLTITDCLINRTLPPLTRGYQLRGYISSNWLNLSYLKQSCRCASFSSHPLYFFHQPSRRSNQSALS